MNKKTLFIGIIFIVIVLAVFAVGLHFANSSHKTNKSFSDLLKDSATVSQRCIFDTNSKYSGEIFLSDNSLRADVRDGSKTKHIILTSSVAYQWNEDPNSGARTTLNEVTLMDVNAKYPFLCQDWKADPSKYTPPVQQVFYSSKEVGQQDTTQTANTECQVCEGLESTALQTCKKQLHCS